MKEKTKTYTSYWKHKRPYGKRVVNKKLRRAAQRDAYRQENQPKDDFGNNVKDRD